MKAISVQYLLLVLFFSQASLGSSDCDQTSASDCCMFSENRGNTAISRILTGGTQPACVVSLSPASPGSTYRRYSFGSDGQISIYVQSHAGSRGAAWFGFLVYPAFENPSINSEGSGLVLQSGSAQSWTFNSENSTPLEIDDCEFNVSPSFSLTNGGVTMKKCTGKLVISVPIEIGGEYIAHPNNPLTVRDPAGKTCEITTSDLYEYIERGPSNTKDRAGRYYNIRLKYPDKATMGRFFKGKCPELDNSIFKGRSSFDEAFENFAPPSSN